MKTISDIREMQFASEQLRLEGKRIGVVPTMGFLHEGHVSLMRQIRTNVDAVIATIFVNPTQFGPSEDFEKYPRDLERDSRVAAEAGVDILFTPDAAAMYPAGYATYVSVEGLAGVLEGKSRPTHFRGVTTIVAKLFNVTKPHVAIFGQKDAQQAVILQRMAKDLNIDVEIIVAPIVREPDGLALSSRNVYLSPAERKDALVLSRSVKHAEELIRTGERRASRIIDEMQRIVGSAPSAKLDYVSVNDPVSLAELAFLSDGSRVLVSMAVRLGATRLIDNTLVHI
jgi:pantoate--beta-alanine ligase